MREHSWFDGDCSSHDEGTDDPIDLVALRADDALLDALAAGEMRAPAGPLDGSDPDDQLVAILATWVAGVRPETPPLRNRPEPTVVAAPPPRPAVRWCRPGYAGRLAAAAGLAVLALSGLALGARQAHPGDTLWGVSKVFYAERARSVEAADAVSHGLARARAALDEGRTVEATRVLADIDTRLATVRPDEGHDELARQQQLLAAQLPRPLTPAGSDPATGAAPARSAASTARRNSDPGAQVALAGPPDGTTPTVGTSPGTAGAQPPYSTQPAAGRQTGPDTPTSETHPTSPPPDGTATSGSPHPRPEGTADGTPPPGSGTPSETDPPPTRANDTPSENTRPDNTEPASTPSNTEPSSTASDSGTPHDAQPNNSQPGTSTANGTQPASAPTADPGSSAPAPDQAAGGRPPTTAEELLSPGPVGSFV